MLNLMANMQPVHYKLWEGQEECLDEYGNPTGSYLPIYSELKTAMLCVSPNKGSAEVEQFGTFADYDRTMTTADTSCPIDENAVLWIDGADTDGAWNYIVKAKAQWKNSLQFAIKRVEVSMYLQDIELRRQQAEIARMREENAENILEPES